MSNTILFHFIEHYGYLAFFLAFSLGPFGIPIPNEVTIMTGAFLSSTGLLNPYITYLFILVGLLTAVTMAYVLGRLFGARINTRFRDYRHLKKAESLIERFGHKAICLAFFIPVIRYVIPLFVGFQKISYKQFALFAYSSALVWTILFFIVGRYLGFLIF